MKFRKWLASTALVISFVAFPAKGQVATDQVGNGTLSGSIVANTPIIALTGGKSIITIDIVGLTASGATLQGQSATSDGVFNPTIAFIGVNGAPSIQTTITTDGKYNFIVSGDTQFRLAETVAGTTGTITYAYSSTISPSRVIAAIANLPPGASNSANQIRASITSPAYQATVAINATTPGNPITLSSPYIFTKFNCLILSNQSGTYTIQGSNDGFTTGINIASGSITANVSFSFSTSLTFTSYRAYYTNTSSSSATATVAASFTAS